MEDLKKHIEEILKDKEGKREIIVVGDKEERPYGRYCLSNPYLGDIGGDVIIKRCTYYIAPWPEGGNITVLAKKLVCDIDAPVSLTQEVVDNNSRPLGWADPVSYSVGVLEKIIEDGRVVFWRKIHIEIYRDRESASNGYREAYKQHEYPKLIKA